jgi:hypothetical protein
MEMRQNSRTPASTHLLAPRDADEHVARTQFVLAMLIALSVVAAGVLLLLALS